MDNLAAHARVLAGHIDRVNHAIGRGAVAVRRHGSRTIYCGRYALRLRHRIDPCRKPFYMYAILFMMAAADTLLAEAHVRVDIFYARLPARKAMVNLFGNALLVLPFCVLLFLVSMDYVRLSGQCWKLARNQRHSGGLSSEERYFGFRRPAGIAGHLRHD